MKNIVIIFLISVVVANTGCKDTHCPAFPPHLVDYYPYRIGDVLMFTNLENDTISVKISSVETSDESSFAWNCECSCDFSHHFITEIDPLALKWLFMEGFIYGGEGYIGIDCRIGDLKSSGNFSFLKENINPHVPENSHIFGDTLIMEYNETGRFSKAVIVKSEGIIEFFDSEYDCIWEKIQNKP